MKPVDFIYAHIYAWYDAMKQDGRRVDPASLTAMWFGFWLNGLLLFAETLYTDFRHVSMLKTNILLFCIVGVTGFGVTNMVYLRGHRYLRVVALYVAARHSGRRTMDTILTWIIVLIPYGLCFVHWF